MPRQPAERIVFLPHRLDWETSGLLVLALSAAAMRSLSSQFAERSVHKTYLADVTGSPPAERGVVDLPLSADPERRPRQRIDLGPTGKKSTTSWAVIAYSGTQSGALGHDAGYGDEEAGEGGGSEVRRRRQAACRLRLTPESGRRHQLRMHCLALGCAIVGDGLYIQPATTHHSAGGDAVGASTCSCTGGGRSRAVGGDAGARTSRSAELNCTRLHLHAAELRFAHPASGEQMEFASLPPFELPSSV